MLDVTSTSTRHARAQCRHAGFTLVELIVTMLLIGALVAVSAVFIVQPFQAAEDLERRAALVDTADQALDRVTRDARRALPNSVRVSAGGQRVEFIPVRVGARYRRLPGDGSSNTFVPAQTAGTFDVLGGLLLASDELDDLADAINGAGTDCGSGIPCISVYNTGQAGFNAYEQENIAQVTALATDSISYDNAGANTPAFAAHSPRQRVYLFDTVVTYECTGNELRRAAGYGVDGSPGSGRLVAANVSRCNFAYDPGTATRRGLLTIELGLTRGGETVNLLDQAQVPNAP